MLSPLLILPVLDDEFSAFWSDELGSDNWVGYHPACPGYLTAEEEFNDWSRATSRTVVGNDFLMTSTTTTSGTPAGKGPQQPRPR